MARGRGHAADPSPPAEAAAVESAPAAARGAPQDLRAPRMPDDLLVDVRRSPRRRRTVSAYRNGDSVVVLLPAGLDAAQEARWIHAMLSRLDGQEQRRRPDDIALAARAAGLSRRYLAGRAAPTSVRWVHNQGTRWGSCTPSDGSIRISDRLRGVPTWVLDYVVLHELAHLLEPGHGARFWRLLEAYPRTERARGFLEGLEHTQGHAQDHAADEGDPRPGDVAPDVSR